MGTFHIGSAVIEGNGAKTGVFENIIKLLIIFWAEFEVIFLNDIELRLFTFGKFYGFGSEVDSSHIKVFLSKKIGVMSPAATKAD